MSVIKKLAGETLIYGMASILPRILFFFMTLIYLTYRFPANQDYGAYNELYAYVTVLLSILVYRLDTAYFRFGSQAEEKEKVFSTALIPVIVSAVISVILLLYFSQSIADTMSYGDRPHYIQWFAIIIGCDAVAAMFYARFRLASQPKRFLFYRLANVLLTIFFILFFLEILPRISIDARDNIGAIFHVAREIDYVFLANLLASIFIIILLLPDLFRISWDVDKPLLKKMLWYALPLVVVAIAGNVNQAFAVPLQKYFLGDDIQANLGNAGVYAAAAKIALLLNLFTVAFNYAAEPFFFNNAKEDKEKSAYGKVALAFTLVSLIVMIMLVSGLDLIRYLVGDNYREAIHLVPILLMAYFMLGIYYNVSIWYKLADKTHMGALISIIGAIITLVVSIYYLPKIGYSASAYAALATYTVMVVICYYLGQKHYPIHYPVKKILSYTAIAVVTILAVVSMRNYGWVWMPAISGTLVSLGILSWVWIKERETLLS